MIEQVHIVALGARTVVGRGAEASCAAARAGVSRVRLDTSFTDATANPLRTARDAGLPAKLPLARRLSELGSSALSEVLQKLGAACAGPLPPLAVLVAFAEEQLTASEGDARTVASELLDFTRASAGVTRATLSAARSGHAGGLVAIQTGMEQLRSGAVDIVIAGGVDSYFHAETLKRLDGNRQLATETTRGGFQPGEGAGFVALAGESLVRRLRLPSLAIVEGAGTASERHRINTDEPCRGVGLASAITHACSAITLPQEAPRMVFCDINGERYRAEEWGLAQLQIGHLMRTTDYISAMTSWGEVGSASGALLCALACSTWARGWATDERALIWAGSESGTRGAVVLRKSNER